MLMFEAMSWSSWTAACVGRRTCIKGAARCEEWEICKVFGHEKHHRLTFLAALWGLLNFCTTGRPWRAREDPSPAKRKTVETVVNWCDFTIHSDPTRTNLQVHDQLYTKLCSSANLWAPRWLYSNHVAFCFDTKTFSCSGAKQATMTMYVNWVVIFLDSEATVHFVLFKIT